MKDYASAFESEEWLECRRDNLMRWLGNAEAVRFIEIYGDIAEFFDDLWDGDKEVSHDSIRRAMLEVLIELPNDPFYCRHQAFLTPLMISHIQDWLAANELERRCMEAYDDDDLNRSFMLRSSYVSIVQAAVYLARGQEAADFHAVEICDFFLSEPLEEYKQKFRSKANGNWKKTESPKAA